MHSAILRSQLSEGFRENDLCGHPSHVGVLHPLAQELHLLCSSSPPGQDHFHRGSVPIEAAAPQRGKLGAAVGGFLSCQQRRNEQRAIKAKKTFQAQENFLLAKCPGLLAASQSSFPAKER